MRLAVRTGADARGTGVIGVRVAVPGRGTPGGDGVSIDEATCADASVGVSTVVGGVAVFGWAGPQATSSPTSSVAAS